MTAPADVLAAAGFPSTDEPVTLRLLARAIVLTRGSFVVVVGRYPRRLGSASFVYFPGGGWPIGRWVGVRESIANAVKALKERGKTGT